MVNETGVSIVAEDCPAGSPPVEPGLEPQPAMLQAKADAAATAVIDLPTFIWCFLYVLVR
jgi:hypothetical protein